MELIKKKVSYIEQRAMPQFNCTTHKIKTPAIKMLDRHGKIVASNSSKNQFNPVIAGSSDAQVESLVCQVHKMVGGM
jgi:phage terminase small subunit